MARSIIHQALLASAAALTLDPSKSSPLAMLGWAEEASVGVMNKFGVTRYTTKKISRVNSSTGFFWPDATSRSTARFSGATDLTDNISWGWHHPNGQYNTIPVGAPLIDNEMNIYLASDDAIRKFSPSGDLIWSYAPRGQIACAPTLTASASERRRAAGDSEALSSEEEAALRPLWSNETSMRESAASELFTDVKVGDKVRALPGKGYHANGKEFYKAGDVGLVRELSTGATGEDTVLLHWSRTGEEIAVQLASMGQRFAHIQAGRAEAVVPDLLVGSTTTGYVFAIGLYTGEEVWATKASKEIHGVKGSVGIQDGVVVVATDRCVDHLCYRYRNNSLLTPSNLVVRGLDVVTGRSLWSFKPFNPVWNFVPQFGNNTVMFQDFSGYAYSLNLQTGALNWRVDGALGTHTQAMAVYDKDLNMLYSMGVDMYEHKYCNPYPSPGILPWCGTWPGTKGWVKGLDGSTGSKRWEISTDEPPASATIGKLRAVGGQLHQRLVLTMGFNCHYNSPTHIWAIDGHNGHKRWVREGPTLWSTECAGDFEAGDVRRAMGGRSICEPGSWSAPVVDSNGDIFVGNQVGELQKWSSPTGTNRGWELVSTLNTGVAFQDQSIAIAYGIMAVSTCNALIVLQTEGAFQNETWSVPY